MDEIDDAARGNRFLADGTVCQDTKVLPRLANVDDEAGAGGNIVGSVDGYVRARGRSAEGEGGKV